MTQPGSVIAVAELVDVAVRIAGLALLAGLAGAVVSFLYRWYARDRLPEGIGVLFGVSVVAIVLNTQSALQSAILGRTDLLSPKVAVFTVVAFVTAAIVADAGRRTGDRLGQRTARTAALRDLGEMGRIVRSAGRSVTVTLPEDPGEIRDIDGYDPLPEADKETLAETTFVFPRGLTVAQLRDRLVQRLKADHGVGHVDVEITVDGEIEYLGVGSRAAGIGVTIGPGSAAVAIHADPAFTASPGDTVQVWQGGEDPDRVTTAELRGVAGDVVTIALDEADAGQLDDTTRYRLATLAGDPSAEREFASLLRGADETMGVATIAPDSPLVGVPIGGLAFTVVAVRNEGGIEAIPQRSRTVAAGDRVYVVARPEGLRRFEAAAAGSGTASRVTADEEPAE